MSWFMASKLACFGVAVVCLIDQPALSAFPLVFRGNQTRFSDTQTAQSQCETEQRPQNDVDDERWVHTEMETKRSGQDNRPDQHDQQGCRAITHIETREIQSAGGTARSKGDDTAKQGACATFGAETKKGGLRKWRPPLDPLFRGVVHWHQPPWTGAPQPPQT